MTEYTFDVKLWAVARVVAATKAEAEAKLADVVACLDVGFVRDDVTIHDASAEGDFDLIEIDGEAV